MKQLTKKDFKWEYSGKSCRCTHEASGVTHLSSKGNTKEENYSLSFEAVMKDHKMKIWIKEQK